MTSAPRVVVVGSGMAAYGHTRAFRAAGAEVLGLTSRTEAAVRAMAEQLAVPRWSTDWRALLSDLRPDVVSVATPGGAHVEVCEAAMEAGVHVFCDKPLATTAADARRLYLAARRAGVKTAFAEAYRYQPYNLFARELVRSGAIGAVHEVECVSHSGWPARMPFGWVHRLDQGGGRLSGGLPHTLSMVQHVVGGEPLAVMGEGRNDVRRAPVGGPVHHMHEYMQHAYSAEEAAEREWRDADAEWSFTALVRLGDPGTPLADAVSVCIRHSALTFGRAEYVAFYGEEGTIHIDGQYATGPLRLGRRTATPPWTELPLPQHIQDTLMPGDNDMERNWGYLARELLADIQGEGYSGYQTFRDGWIYQEIIDAIRTENSWMTLQRPDFDADPDMSLYR